MRTYSWREGSLKAVSKPERADLRPGLADLRLTRPDRADLRCEWADLSSDRSG